MGTKKGKEDACIGYLGRLFANQKHITEWVLNILRISIECFLLSKDGIFSPTQIPNLPVLLKLNTFLILFCKLVITHHGDGEAFSRVVIFPNEEFDGM